MSLLYKHIYRPLLVPRVLNYYDILGVNYQASKDEIKKSFRNLALRYHPDKNKNSADSKNRFMQIIEAYEILSDETARREYDNSRSLGTYDYGSARHWTPSADFDRIYSYSEIKRRYGEDMISGGIWDISERASIGLWKATIILFGCLGAVAILIMIFH